jgi:integrase
MPRQIHKLKATTVKALKNTGRYSDGGGLWLQVSRWGTKSWLFQYTAPDGKIRQMGLGGLTNIGLADARQLASEARKLVALGTDPIEARYHRRAALRATNAKAVTFRQFAEHYIESQKPGWKHGKHALQWSASLRMHAYSVLGDLQVSAIDKGHILRVLEPIWQTLPETASRLRGRIENILDAVKVRELRTGDNPAVWKGNLDKVLPSARSVKKVKHHAALPFTEVGRFVTELRKREGISPRALEFTILTAARTNEVIGAQWPEFDFPAKIWTIPATRMKAKREHRVPLPERALALLRRLPREKNNPYVFLGAQKEGLSNMSMLQLLKGKHPDLTVHGFRSTFRDWASETTAYPNFVVEMALAHVIADKTESAYRRGELLEKRRRLMGDWARYCDRSSSTKAGNIVPLRRKETTQTSPCLPRTPSG